MNCYRGVLFVLGVLQLQLLPSDAYVPPSRPSRNRVSRGSSRRHGQGGDGNHQPPRSFEGKLPFDDDSTWQTPLIGALSDEWRNETDAADTQILLSSSVRGGSNNRGKEKPDMITSTTSYWKNAADSVVSTLTNPFRSLGKRTSSLFKSKEKKYDEALMEMLRTMPVKRVTVPNSTVLPQDVVQIAAKRAGVLGSPLKSERVQDLAQSLKRWYVLKGYVLHSVTGATLKPETATAEIIVQEPVISAAPVGISFYKEMVIDQDSGDLLTLRQYKERHQRRRTLGFEELKKEDLNTTFVPTTGRTKASRIAAAMGMKPGKPFQWDNVRWQKITGSGLFSRILQATPKPMGDGTVQLHIVATEAPSKHLEYGVGKSLYTGGWEGELDFEHANLLGGGETLGVSVRRGTKDAIPSIRLKFNNGRLGLEGGYDIEAFSEFIGDEGDVEDTLEQPEGLIRLPDYNKDTLVSRRGTTLRVRNPIDPKTIRHTVASASLERTSTATGLHETIGSTTMEVGPFLKELPMGARSNLDASFTTGTRIGREALLSSNIEIIDDGATTGTAPFGTRSILPYASVSATTRQLFPLMGPMNPSSSSRRPLILAVRHSLIASTRNVPRHVARAIGTSCTIRGSTPNGRVSSALRGTTELRVPIQLPSRLKVQQDASIVFFGDWLLAVKDPSTPISRKTSVGLGLRKSIQGIPLQYDVIYSDEGKLKSMFGLGSDFVF